MTNYSEESHGSLLMCDMVKWLNIYGKLGFNTVLEIPVQSDLSSVIILLKGTYQNKESCLLMSFYYVILNKEIPEKSFNFT